MTCEAPASATSLFRVRPGHERLVIGERAAGQAGLDDLAAEGQQVGRQEGLQLTHEELVDQFRATFGASPRKIRDTDTVPRGAPEPVD